jgi:hypothetical protein
MVRVGLLSIKPLLFGNDMQREETISKLRPVYLLYSKRDFNDGAPDYCARGVYLVMRDGDEVDLARAARLPLPKVMMKGGAQPVAIQREEIQDSKS